RRASAECCPAPESGCTCRSGRTSGRGTCSARRRLHGGRSRAWHRGGSSGCRARPRARCRRDTAPAASRGWYAGAICRRAARSPRPPRTSNSSETLGFQVPWSPFLRRDFLDRRREALVRGEIDRPVLHCLAGRVIAEVVAALPVALRPDRPRREVAAAVRTHVAEQLDAGRAEGALEAADARIERVRRKRHIAVFAVRSQFQHLQVRLDSTKRSVRSLSKNFTTSAAGSSGATRRPSAWYWRKAVPQGNSSSGFSRVARCISVSTTPGS